jgi:hypothetical protein
MTALSPEPRHFLWVLRVAWVSVATAVGLALGTALQQASSTARIVSSVAWWAAVGMVVVALVVPGPLSLTVARVLVPASIPVAVIAWMAGAGAARGIGGTALAAVATVVVLSAECAEALAQGSAYGHERRFPLRTPAAILPIAIVTWLVWCAVLLAALVLVCQQRWVVGGALGALAVALTWLTLTRQHRLSNRWLVLLPAAVVVHDPLLLGETLMVPRANVTGAALATTDTQAADLSGPAAGVAVEVATRDAVTVVFPSSAEHPLGRAIHARAFLVCPSRPGRALQAMAEANLPVG